MDTVIELPVINKLPAGFFWVVKEITLHPLASPPAFVGTTFQKYCVSYPNCGNWYDVTSPRVIGYQDYHYLDHNTPCNLLHPLQSLQESCGVTDTSTAPSVGEV